MPILCVFFYFLGKGLLGKGLEKNVKMRFRALCSHDRNNNFNIMTVKLLYI
jgi:hypothetical protein